jgi:hypothetical protein
LPSCEGRCSPGSALEPILFLLYINDITEGLECLSTLLADNASLIKNVIRIDKAAVRINHDLNFIEQWSIK